MKHFIYSLFLLSQIFFLSAQGSISFTELTGAANPFNGLTFSTPRPTMADLDGDGDQDALIGNDGNCLYFLNTGTSSTPIFTQQANPFGLGSINSSPALVDIDGDGDQDVFIGYFINDVSFFKNTGTSSNPVFVIQYYTSNPFYGLSIHPAPAPAFADLDGDGDKDAFMSAGDYYKNIGTANAPVFIAQTGVANPFSNLGFSLWNKVDFVDIDGDGDQDMFQGGGYAGPIRYYQNTGTSSTPIFTEQTGTANPFDVLTSGANGLAATFVDIDGDGDKDAFIGSGNSIRYFRNDCVAPNITSVATSNSPICTGGTLNLSVASSGTNPLFYSWTGAGTFTNGETANPTVLTAATGSYNVTISNACGAVSSSTAVTVNTIPLSTITASGATTFCTGGSVNLSAPTSYNNPSAITFNGSQYVQLPHFARPLNMTTESWIKTSASSGNMQILGWAGTTGNSAEFKVSNGFIGYYEWDGVTFPSVSGPFVADGNWHHVAVVRTSAATNNASLYVDGVLTNTATVSHTITTNDLSIGTFNYFGYQQFFTGTIDEVRVWNVARTGAEIQANMNVSAPSNSSGLLAYYRMNEGTGNMVANATANSYHGTLQNGSTWTTATPSINRYMYVWQPSGARTSSITVTTSGSFSVDITSEEGCVAHSQSVATTLAPLPATPTITALNTVYCKTSGVINLAATPSGGIFTVDGNMASSFDTDVLGAGSHTVIYTYTDNNNCSASTNQDFTLFATPPAPSITATNTSVCEGASVTLTGVAPSGLTATEYAWFRNGTFVKYSNTSADYTFSALAGTNNYKLVIITSTSGGCPSNQSPSPVVVTGVAPIAVITPSVAPPYCVGAAPTLNATPPSGTGYTYSWIGTSPSAATTTTATFVPTTSGNHRVIVTDANGCSKSSAWFGVPFSNLPAVYPGTNQSTCVNNSVSIGSTTTAGLSYSWAPSTHLSSPTVSNPTVTPTSTGTINYTLTVTSALGCKNTGTVSVTTATQPATPSLTSTSSPVCQGATITLIPSGTTGAINWYKNGVLSSAAAATAQVTLATSTANADIYTIRAKNGNCLSEASGFVSAWIKPAPTPTLSATPAIVSNIVSVCNPGQTSGTAQLMANLPLGAPTATYNWQQVVSGVTTNVNPAATTSSYTASVATSPTTANNKVFRAQVTYSNACVKNTSNVTVKMLQSTCNVRTGLADDLTEEIITTYPNPTENVLTVNIQNSTASEGELVVYNALGQVITSRTIFLINGSCEETLDLSRLASGVYTLSFQTKDGIKVEKIVKE